MTDNQRSKSSSVQENDEPKKGAAYVPSARGRAMLSILHQYGIIERWSPEKILSSQFGKIGKLLAHASNKVPYYQTVVKECGIADPANVTPEEWARLPFLDRSKIQAAGKDLHSLIIPPGHGRAHAIYTSGTTGRPVRVLRTDLSNLYWSATTLRDHLWHRRNFKGKLAVMRNAAKGKDPYPDGSRSQTWGASSNVFKTGPAVSLNLNCTPAEQVEWLQRENPDYLMTHPTNLYRLASYCLENGIRLEKLRETLTISEMLRPEVRDACRAAWGVGVSDIYSGRDVGYLALQCPDHEHYHVQAEGLYLEVLSQDGTPCAPGETGRVVVTPLDNFAMPLIRYDIGDFAEVGDPCPCGRGLPVLKRIVGRVQDMVVLPGGERRWTLLSAGNIESFLEIAPIRQYQFVQKDLQTIEVRLVMDRGLSEPERDGIRDWVNDKLDHPFSVTVSMVDDIPRTPAGKYQDFISEIDAPPEPLKRAHTES
ncbi:MAG: phenylacetate--CoA ligase family protein [Rhodospirillales bacterium]|nr:phenylacetate--CoA ligase family protein [Alphaproteobacteria bacterium]MBL6948894.1 phenylacetate--CoA ligase family protein [Rhodospirillales bacterium]